MTVAPGAEDLPAEPSDRDLLVRIAARQDTLLMHLDHIAVRLNDVAHQLNGRLGQLLKAREAVAHDAGRRQEEEEEHMRRVREYTGEDP